jgi:hypothetical protein
MSMLKTLSAIVIALAVQQNAMAELLVPAYFYPSSDLSMSFWDDMTNVASQTSITAIVNPASGPGSAANPEYTNAISAFRNAGGHVVAYIPTGYGARAQSEVLADLATYNSFYTVDGVFLDEMSNQATDLAFYQSLYNTIKTNNAGYQVIGNPGTATLESYLTAADVLVTFEHDPIVGAYSTNIPANWTKSYSADHFANLLYNVTTETDMLVYASIANQNNVGYLYITNDTLPNPWDTLPSYWLAEANRVSSVPLSNSAIFALMGIGLISVMQFKRRSAILL